MYIYIYIEYMYAKYLAGAQCDIGGRPACTFLAKFFVYNIGNSSIFLIPGSGGAANQLSQRSIMLLFLKYNALNIIYL